MFVISETYKFSTETDKTTLLVKTSQHAFAKDNSELLMALTIFSGGWWLPLSIITRYNSPATSSPDRFYTCPGKETSSVAVRWPPIVTPQWRNTWNHPACHKGPTPRAPDTDPPEYLSNDVIIASVHFHTNNIPQVFFKKSSYNYVFYNYLKIF